MEDEDIVHPICLAFRNNFVFRFFKRYLISQQGKASVDDHATFFQRTTDMRLMPHGHIYLSKNTHRLKRPYADQGANLNQTQLLSKNILSRKPVVS